MTFSERVHAIQRASNSLLCIGLDTDPRKIPKGLSAFQDPVLEFNRRIIESTKDLVCAYKVNLAFYEGTGTAGRNIIHKTLEFIPSDIMTIGDAKRGDIGNSSDYYARTLLEEYGFTACTVNPYMGEDSVRPFLRNPEQGAFILALTSNPGARDFQYLRAGGRPLYEHVVLKVRKWNTAGNCGLVVGATRPAELKRVRQLVPDIPLLIPGIGMQGGDLKRVVRYGCNPHGTMAVINASRSILYASAGDDFADAARGAASVLRDEINTYRSQFFPNPR